MLYAFALACFFLLTTAQELPGQRKLFVVGGRNYYMSELVDLKGETGKSCPNLASISASANGIATLTGDGVVGTHMEGYGVIVCGGYLDWNKPLKTCYKYDEAFDMWQQTVSMTRGRHQAAAVKLSPTEWWVTGGIIESSEPATTASTEIFTVGKGFAPYVDLPTNTAFHNLVRVNATHIALFVEESNSAYLFNIATKAWTSLPTIPDWCGITQAGSVTKVNGDTELILASGWPCNSTLIFSFKTNAWRNGQNDFPINRQNEDGKTVPYGNSILAVHGFMDTSNNNREDNAIFVYEAETERWILHRMKLAESRRHFQAIFVPDDFIATCPVEQKPPNPPTANGANVAAGSALFTCLMIAAAAALL